MSLVNWAYWWRLGKDSTPKLIFHVFLISVTLLSLYKILNRLFTPIEAGYYILFSISETFWACQPQPEINTHPIHPKKVQSHRKFLFPLNLLPADVHFIKKLDICFCLCSVSVNHCCSARCCNNILSPLRSICSVEIAVQIRGPIHNLVRTSWGVSGVRFSLFTDLAAASPRTEASDLILFGCSLLWQDTRKDSVRLMDDSYHPR